MDLTTRLGLRRTWIDCLYEFASPTVQSWWCGAAPPGINVSFIELTCCYFGDLNLEDGLDDAVRGGWLRAVEAQATASFHRQADSYQAPSSDCDPQAILADSAWAKVVQAAQRAWFDLRAIPVDPETLSRMDELETKWGRIAQAKSPQDAETRDARDGEG